MTATFTAVLDDKMSAGFQRIEERLVKVEKAADNAASGLEKTGAATNSAATKTGSYADSLAKLGTAWLTLESAKKVVRFAAELSSELADRGVPAFVELTNQARRAREELLNLFDNPRIAAGAEAIGERLRNAASGLGIIAEWATGTTDADRRAARQARGERAVGQMDRIERGNQAAKDIAGINDPEKLKAELERLKKYFREATEANADPEILDQVMQRWKLHFARLNQLEQEKAANEKAEREKRLASMEQAWDQEGQRQKQELEKQKKTYADYLKVLSDMDKEAARQHEADIKKRISDIDRLYQAEHEANEKATKDAADAQAKRTDFLLSKLGGAQQPGGLGGMGAMAAGGLGGGMMGGPGAGVMGGGGLNFNPMTMQRFPFAGGGFFGMDPFRIARGGSGVMPTAWGAGARGQTGGMGAGGGLDGLLGGFDPKRVQNMALRIARGRATDEDGNFNAGEFRRLRRSIKRGEAGDIDAEARGRIATGEIQRAKQRGQLSGEQADEMTKLVQKQTEANVESKQQTQLLDKVNAGIQVLVQQGQPRQGANRGNTGNKGRRR